MKWVIVWSPTGRVIDTVEAKTTKGAINKTPHPYKRYLGEVYAETVEQHEKRIKGV